MDRHALRSRSSRGVPGIACSLLWIPMHRSSGFDGCYVTTNMSSAGLPDGIPAAHAHQVHGANASEAFCTALEGAILARPWESAL
jgi:hypothetical protein